MFCCAAAMIAFCRSGDTAFSRKTRIILPKRANNRDDLTAADPMKMEKNWIPEFSQDVENNEVMMPMTQRKKWRFDPITPSEDLVQNASIM